MRPHLSSVLGLGATATLLASLGLPGARVVESQVLIEAPPESVHAYVADLHTWTDWSAIEPNHARHSGVAVGAGAVMAWRERALRRGTLTVDRSDPAIGIQYALSQTRSLGANEWGDLRYTRVGSSTRVVWTVGIDAGFNPLLRCLGPLWQHQTTHELRQSLTGLKDIVEAHPHSAPDPTHVIGELV